ncbi:DUF723 domain-containing protein [Lactobacillus acetotolerans]|jgi:hypothetical protein|uniref:DUF723 domain-containing protein n=1 Tax=Lactobacillus acetotolerans TaxID=1600 RepID=UPI002480BE4A|nr:DUF723 domain-containing protein [Lactobacillus acetotolerans]
MGKRLTNSEFRKRVKQIHGDQFTILSDYHGMCSKVKIRCNLCNWSGEVLVYNLIRQNYGTRCPKHSHKQFDSSSFQKAINEKQDNQYTLLSEFVNITTKIKVKCNKCGKEFCAWPENLLHRRFGKNCEHKFKLDFKQASKQLNKISDGEIKLVHFSGMHSVATFKCCKCGNIWRATALNIFKHSTGCPICSCSSSWGEKAIDEFLKKHHMAFQGQFRLVTCRDEKPLPFDFAVFNRDGSLNSLIEYQGCQHFINPFQYKKNDFINKESVLKTQKHDAMKLSFCKEHGIKLIYINHPQNTGESNKHSFIADLVKRTLDKELKVS